MSHAKTFAAEERRLADAHDDFAAKGGPFADYHRESARQLRELAAQAEDPRTPLGRWIASLPASRPGGLPGDVGADDLEPRLPTR